MLTNIFVGAYSQESTDSHHGTRVKREAINYRLNVPHLRQPYVTDCAPTTVQCILFYFGRSTEVMLLRQEMGTIRDMTRYPWGEKVRLPEGTDLESLTAVLNIHIRNGNLNQNRQYRITFISFGLRVDELIRESLRVNMPLILATNSHVRVINGIQGNIVELMDPADGQFHHIEYDVLMNNWNLGINSFLIHYNSTRFTAEDPVEIVRMCIEGSMPQSEFLACVFPDFRYNNLYRGGDKYHEERQRRSLKIPQQTKRV